MKGLGKTWSIPYLWSPIYISWLTLFALLAWGVPLHAVDTGGTNSFGTGKVEQGFLLRIFQEVNGNRHLWANRFCELALSQRGEDYVHFVRLARMESTALNNEERRLRLVGPHPFSHYLSDDTRIQAYQCLEHGGAHAPAIVQYELYMLIGFDVSGRRFYWLKRAAEGGVANAQVDFAMQIFRYRGSVTKETPEVLREEIKAERFYYWIKRAADGGLPRGLYELAKLHLGHYADSAWTAPSPVDASLAIQILEKIAQETSDAAVKARAVNQSKTWVIPEFIESDALIRSRAVGALGSLYYLGKHVAQDYGIALKWYSEVDEVYIWHCRAPLSGVRYSLLTMYEKGLGTEKNPEKVRYYSQHLRLGC
jgi:hypothetical protein